MRYARLMMILMVMAIIPLGCAHKPEQELPAEDLFREAQSLAKDGKVDKAAEAYMKVRTYYPGNELAKESLIGLGDLYFEHEDYQSALGSYQEFRLLYPTDPKASYSLFRIAQCHSKQLSTLDRDQTETINAIRAYENFLKLYPDSPYGLEAQEKLRDAKTLLAKNWLYIGKFYLKNHDKKAACKRFQDVKGNFTGLGLDEEVDKLIAEACTP
jgi:outer membrane protein assembly factor BamD